MKLFRVLLFALLFPIWSHADEAGLPANQRIFLCAHSFMYYVNEKLPPMAQAAGIHYVPAGLQTIASSRVLAHWDLPEPRNLAKAALSAGNVDTLLVSPYLQLPDEGIDNFAHLGLAKNPKLRVLVQASWAAFDAVGPALFHNAMRDASTKESLLAMQARQRSLWLDTLETQVRNLNSSIGHEAVFIVPVCDAVVALRQKMVEGKAPGLGKQSDLFRDDLGHPQAVVAELVTYCHFAAIFRRSPVGLPVPGDLQRLPEAAELNRLLQQLAWDAVVNYPMSGVKAPAMAEVGAR